MKFVFSVWPPEATDRPGHFNVPQVTRYARTFEQALQSAQEALQEGQRFWCWWTVPEESCTMCHGPFHPATGHWESETRHWCGPCAKDMYAMLKTFIPRRWGGVRFYDHATVPTGDTSAADLLADQK